MSTPRSRFSTRRRNLEDAILTLARNSVRSQSNQTSFDRIARLRPLTYDGAADLTTLENWIREMRKMFDVIGFFDREKVSIASFYLQGEADNWWCTVRANPETDLNLGWDSFTQMLQERFYPDELM